MRAALDAGLTVILCVGEILEQREQGITSELVAMQTKIALGGVSEEELKSIIIAYEPVWAIGTGKTATAEQANEVCAHHPGVHRRSCTAQAAADGITIQYGGSMNAKQRRRAAGPARRGRRPHRRRRSEAPGLRRHRCSRAL